MFRRFRREDGNLIVALAAVVISVCALYISVQEVRIMRMQQRISLYPYVKVSQSYGAEGFSITARNSGSGLAKINFFELSSNLMSDSFLLSKFIFELVVDEGTDKAQWLFFEFHQCFIS